MIAISTTASAIRARGMEGIVAKRLDGFYESGERAMLKVKRLRSADCVVGGFRYGSEALLAFWYGERATKFISENLAAVSYWVAGAVLVGGVASGLIQDDDPPPALFRALAWLNAPVMRLSAGPRVLVGPSAR